MGVGSGVGVAIGVGAGVGKGVATLPPQATAIKAASSRQGRNRIFNGCMSVLQIRVGIVSKWSVRGRETLGVGQRDSSGTGGSRTAPTGMTGARAQHSVWNATWGAVRDDMWGGGMRDGFPPPSLRGRALRGNDGGGWVPASARTTGGGGGMRDGFPPPSLRGQALRGNDGGGWVPASARTTGGGGGMRDGFPPPSLRGQALRGNDGGGWVPASARTTGGGGGMRDGVGGWVPAPVFTGAGSAREQRMGPN